MTLTKKDLKEEIQKALKPVVKKLNDHDKDFDKIGSALLALDKKITSSTKSLDKRITDELRTTNVLLEGVRSDIRASGELSQHHSDRLNNHEERIEKLEETV
ncbi:hypothetical protein ACFLRA_03755 [Bdellovibrionota bacterium]